MILFNENNYRDELRKLLDRAVRVNSLDQEYYYMLICLHYAHLIGVGEMADHDAAASQSYNIAGQEFTYYYGELAGSLPADPEDAATMDTFLSAHNAPV